MVISTTTTTSYTTTTIVIKYIYIYIYISIYINCTCKYTVHIIYGDFIIIISMPLLIFRILIHNINYMGYNTCYQVMYMSL